MIEYKKTSDFPKGTFYNQLADKYSFVTVVDGEPVGHISLDPRNCPEYVEIGHNCILTKFKGKGYGKLQLQEALRRIKEYEGLKKIIVTTNAFLLPAQKNYEAAGFVKVGERTNNKTPFTGNYIDYEIVVR